MSSTIWNARPRLWPASPMAASAAARGRLVGVNVLERLGRDRLALRLDVHDLAGHHAAGAGRVRDLGDDIADDPGVLHQRRVLGDELEGQREQRVTRED